MAERDSPDLIEQIHAAGQAYLARAAHSDDALLMAIHLMEVESLLVEIDWAAPASSLDLATRTQLRRAINELRHSPDPIGTGLGARLAAQSGPWLA